MADRLFTSSSSDKIIRDLRYDTKISQTVLSKMAFMLSLTSDGKKVDKSIEFEGMRINKSSFFGDEELFIRTLIRYVYGKTDYSKDEIFSNRSIIKNHIDNGAELMFSIYEESENNGDGFLKKIVSIASKNLKNSLVGKDLDIFIGKSILGNDDVIIELNNSLKHANSHMAIMGKPGVGKTQFLLKILSDIRVQSNYQTNFIFFDYKGDVVTNEKFVDVSKTAVYNLLKNNGTIPINPFILSSYDNQSILVSAREKAESFASINQKLGSVQKGMLSEAIKEAYFKREKMESRYPDFKEVFTITKELYQNEGKRDDSLIEVLRDLSQFNLFWSHGDSTKPISKLFNKTMIIDVHNMPVLKELVAYLVIERLYKEMLTLPDSPIENGRKTIRTVLAIDEAHNYLPQNNIFLEKIIREGRSKGIFVFFASQSPNDYQQKLFNFQELLEFSFIFQTEGASAKSIQDILGCSNTTAKILQTELSKLEPFQVISSGMFKNNEFSKFTAEPFYKNY
jgi:DNA sulfur modification protein DndE